MQTLSDREALKAAGGILTGACLLALFLPILALAAVVKAPDGSVTWTFHGEIVETGVDYHTFPANKDWLYVIEIGDGKAPAQWIRVEPRGLYMSNEDTSRGKTRRRITLVPPETKDHRVQVWAVKGPYVLTVTGRADDHGNDWQHATPVALGKTVPGEIWEVPGDVDVFSFQGEKGGIYRIETQQPENPGGVLRVWDRHGSIREDKNRSKPSRSVTFPTPRDDTYYVQVWGGVGKYTLRITRLMASDEPEVASREVKEDREGRIITRIRYKDGSEKVVVTDEKGRTLKEEKVSPTRDGGQRVETTDYVYGTRTQAKFDKSGRKMREATVDVKSGRPRSRFERQPDGTAIETIHRTGGWVTQMTYDKEDRVSSYRILDKDKRVVETFQRHKDGSASYKIFNHKTGVTTEGEIWENGSRVVKQVDKDGTVLNEVGMTKEGGVFSYTIGGDAENAWKSGSTFSKGRAVSKQSFITGTYGESQTYESPRQAEMDRKLIEQMNGGTAVAGEDLIVRSTWKSKVEFESREAMNKRLRESDYEQITSDKEIRSIDPKGPYYVRHVGRNPVKGSGYGESPSEALSNALNEAAHVVRTDIESELVRRTNSSEASKAGKTTDWSREERVSKRSESRANVILKDYKVTAVKKIEFGYEVVIEASSGVTVRK